MNLFNQYKKDIKPIENNINKAYGNFAQSGIDLIKQSYINAIDVMISYHIQVRNDFLKNRSQYKDIGTGNTIPLLEKQRKLIEEYE